MNRALHWIGGLLGIAGIVFVVLKLRDNAGQIDLRGFEPYAWATMIFLAFVYGSANTLLARAWWLLLKSLNVYASWNWAIKAYGVSQLAKYLPGNIFHLAGRQALGQAAGFPAKLVAKSAVYELALVATAGVLFATLAFPLLTPHSAAFFGLIAYLVIFSAVIYGVQKWLGPTIAKAMCWDSLFFVISGTVFIVTLSLINSEVIHIEIIPILCGSYIISWLIGLLTPGAPAGIGVREVVLTFLLGRIVPEADLLLAVVLSRVVTMLGDLGFFAVTSALKAKSL
jgi:uncharacterized membrane protein YbhN (UPF0104 family)